MIKNNHSLGLLRHSGLNAWEKRFFVTLLCLLFSTFQIIPSALAVSSSDSPFLNVICSSAGILNTPDSENNQKPNLSGAMCKFCPTASNNFTGLVSSFASAGVFSLADFTLISFKSQLVGNISIGAQHRDTCRGPPIAYVNNTAPPSANIIISILVDDYLKELVL